MTERINQNRRRFLGTAATMTAGAQLAMMRSTETQAATAPRTRPKTNTSFGTLKQIDAGVLSIGYAEVGPTSGTPVILLHGWPYDIHSFIDVAPLLGEKGFRVLIPHLRGYGTTRFLSSETARNGQQAALAADCVAFMDALGIAKAILGGFDWGARTINIVAALWPARCKAMVSVSGYLIGSQEANKMPLPPRAELEWWYQYYFATDRGRAGYGHALWITKRAEVDRRAAGPGVESTPKPGANATPKIRRRRAPHPITPRIRATNASVQFPP